MRDEKQTVLYYLVHLTKENMVKKSGEMTFFPITLRLTDQLGLDVAEQAPYPTLQRYLRQKYVGRTLTFVDRLNDDYLAGHQWVDPQYKKALKEMETQRSAGGGDPKGQAHDRYGQACPHSGPPRHGRVLRRRAALVAGLLCSGPTAAQHQIAGAAQTLLRSTGRPAALISLASRNSQLASSAM
jgi:hypothetical protein